MDNPQKLNKKRYIAWVLYDVANTFYASGVLTFLSITWILIIAQQNGYTYTEAGLIYAYVIAIASIFMAVLLPVLGSLSDVTQQRKNYVIFFTIISIISTLSFLIVHNLVLFLIIFAISLITYQWAQVFYDSMLPGIVPLGREARLSSIAIALGYLGGATITGIAFFLAIKYDDPNADPGEGVITLGYSEILIIAVVIGFTLLSIPLLFVRETNWEKINILVKTDPVSHSQKSIPSSSLNKRQSIREITSKSFKELIDSFKDIYNNNRGMFFYIVAYFIIADIANLVVIINVPYLRDGINVENDQVIYTVAIITGLSLMIFTYPLGIICDRYGAKRGFQIIGFLWVSSLITLALLELILPLIFLYFAAILLGPAISGLWVCQRQMVLELVPDEGSIGKYFGMTKFSGKLSSAMGPIIFTGTLYFFNNQLHTSLQTAYRWSIFNLAIIISVGFIILQLKVPNNHEEFKQRRKIISEKILIIEQKEVPK